MSLSQGAIDVLRINPWRDNSFIDVDTDVHLSIGLPPCAGLTGTVLEDMREAWGKADTRISVDFLNCKIHLKQTSNAIARAPCTCALPTASTASEIKAVALAGKLGIIDYDDLVPQYKLRTHDLHTELNISGLVNVNHDAIQRYVVAEDYCLRYRLADNEIAVLVPRENKRKRGYESE